MKDDFVNLASSLSEKEKNLLLIKDKYPYFIAAAASILIAVFQYINGNKLLVPLFVICAIAFVCYGSQYLFQPESKKKEMIISILINEKIKELSKAGCQLSNDEIDSFHFAYDPAFHEQVMANIRNEEDRIYQDLIDAAQQTIDKLNIERETALKTVEEKRWTKFSDHLSYNLTEGKMLIFGNVIPFSYVFGAEIIEDTNKNNPGGNCRQIKVRIDINGNKRDMYFINKEVSKNSQEYKLAILQATNFMKMINELCRTKIDDDYLRVEEEDVIIALDEKIDRAIIELERRKNNKPDYSVPSRYLRKIPEL